MKKTFLISVLSFSILFSFGVVTVFAQPANTPNPRTSNTPNNGRINTVIPNPFNCGGAGASCNLFTFINVIVDKVVLPLGGVLVVLAFIWSGFMYVTAQGKPGEIEKANKSLLYTAIGTAILLGAKVLTSVISNTVNSLRA